MLTIEHAAERFPNLRPLAGWGRPPVDLRGQTFGKLVAEEILGVSNHHVVWRCRCACGNESAAFSGALRKGRTTHCGCSHANARHRMIKSGAYKSWTQMLKRVRDVDGRWFEYYGARGITVCDRWQIGDGVRGGFECFLADMGDRPEGLTLERTDNDGNYEPGNCKWATWAEQCLNRRPAKNRRIR